MKVISQSFASTLLIAVCLLPAGANASLFSWTAGNTDIIVNTDSLQLTVDGITATAQAFTAEINAAGDDAVVVGPWLTQTGGPNTPGFGINVRGFATDPEALGLIADPSIDSDANGSDYFSGGVAPGFRSSYACPPFCGVGTGVPDGAPDAPPAFHFALFSFDQPVDIPGVTVVGVTNQKRDIWAGTGVTAPDFTSGFLSGLAGFDIVNSQDDGSAGTFTHNFPTTATGITQLLVGAPPEDDDLGPLLGRTPGSQFFIESFEGTLSSTEPDPDDNGNGGGGNGGSGNVPVPTTLALLGIGMLVSGYRRRR